MSQFDRVDECRAERTADDERNDDSDATPDARSLARTESEMEPAEAFSVVGNETRVDILRALLDLGADDAPVSFTEIFEAVDVEDSANFSYHLRQLTGHFIRQREGGYEFRYPGRTVVSAIFTGALTERTQLGFFPVDGSCYECRGDLHGWYVDEQLSIGCTECGTVQVDYPFPPGALDDRSTEALLDAFHHYVRHHYCLAADGVCPECAGEVASTLIRTPEDEDLAVALDHVCRRCGYRLRSTAGISLLDNADVLVFHSERGVDLDAEPFWHFDWCVSDARTVVRSEDPLRVELELACGGDVLRVRLDETGSVVETAVVDGIAQ